MVYSLPSAIHKVKGTPSATASLIGRLLIRKYCMTPGARASGIAGGAWPIYDTKKGQMCYYEGVYERNTWAAQGDRREGRPAAFDGAPVVLSQGWSNHLFARQGANEWAKSGVKGRSFFAYLRIIRKKYFEISAPQIKALILAGFSLTSTLRCPTT